MGGWVEDGWCVEKCGDEVGGLEGGWSEKCVVE